MDAMKGIGALLGVLVRSRASLVAENLALRQQFAVLGRSEVPKSLLRGRDGIDGAEFVARVGEMGIEEVLTAPQAPWQNPYVERVIGSIRRECLDHIIVLNEGHLRRLLREYFVYYYADRPHMFLDSNLLSERPVEPPTAGGVVALRRVGGVHHRYTRAA
jgi:transposase InsO family protein